MANKTQKLKNQIINGTLPTGVYAKDIILHLIKTYGVDFGTGYALEFTGETIKNLSMDGRMTICNMAIEGGAKYGIIQPDDITFEYVKKGDHLPITSLNQLISGVSYILMTTRYLIV